MRTHAQSPGTQERRRTPARRGWTRLGPFAAAVLVLMLAGATGTRAQGINDSINAGHRTGVGGTATTGTGVPTGHSPLSQPVPPAANSNNYRYGAGRVPTATSPSRDPFGTR